MILSKFFTFIPNLRETHNRETRRRRRRNSAPVICLHVRSALRELIVTAASYNPRRLGSSGSVQRACCCESTTVAPIESRVHTQRGTAHDPPLGDCDGVRDGGNICEGPAAAAGWICGVAAFVCMRAMIWARVNFCA